jgi:hypothetical protein
LTNEIIHRESNDIHLERGSNTNIYMTTSQLNVLRQSRRTMVLPANIVPEIASFVELKSFPIESGVLSMLLQCALSD